MPQNSNYFLHYTVSFPSGTPLKPLKPLSKLHVNERNFFSRFFIFTVFAVHHNLNTRDSEGSEALLASFPHSCNRELSLLFMSVINSLETSEEAEKQVKKWVEEAIKWCSAWNFRLWRNEKSLSFQFPFCCLMAIDPLTFREGSTRSLPFWSLSISHRQNKSFPCSSRRNKSLSINKGYLDRVMKCFDVMEKKNAQ